MAARRLDLEKSQLLELYEELGSVAAIADLLGCSSKGVSNAMKRYGLEYKQTSQKYLLNHNFFNLPESPAQFYWAGFLAASANVTETNNKEKGYRLEFNLSAQDKSQLQQMVRDFGGNIPVREVTVRVQGQPRQQARLVISSKKMVADLANWGILPKKKFAYQMPEWLVSHALVKDFIRGWVDGRGGFYLVTNHDKRRREFRTSGHIALLEQFIAIFATHLSLETQKPTITEIKNGLGKLRYLCQTDIEKIAKYLYVGASLALPRKKEAALLGA